MDAETDLHAKLQTVTRENRALKAELADYKTSYKAARRRLYAPSFVKELESYKDYIQSTSGQRQFQTLPTYGMSQKLRNYEFIDSHGIPVPSVLSVWPTIASLELDSLPDEFVLKSDGGSTSYGVLPLRRIARDQYRVLDGSRTLTQEAIVAHFKDAFSTGKAYGMLFAEALVLPSDGTDSIPDDVKIYAAYGEIQQVLLRAVDVHGRVSGTRSKYVDEFGASLGSVTSHREIDESIATPRTLPEMVSIARHLSRAAGVPFIRVDLFDAADGVVVGEITRAPGGQHAYSELHDRKMGHMWHLANARLLVDYQAGRPVGSLWGTSDYTEHPGGDGRSAREINRLTIVDCEHWCYSALDR